MPFIIICYPKLIMHPPMSIMVLSLEQILVILKVILLQKQQVLPAIFPQHFPVQLVWCSRSFACELAGEIAPAAERFASTNSRGKASACCIRRSHLSGCWPPSDPGSPYLYLLPVRVGTASTDRRTVSLAPMDRIILPQMNLIIACIIRTQSNEK